MYYEVLPIKIFSSGDGSDLLTYSSNLNLKKGHLVSIPFGRQTSLGIVLKKTSKPNFKTKPINALLFDTPLPTHLLASLKWLSDYYLTPLPQVASLAFPPNPQSLLRLSQKTNPQSLLKTPLNPHQESPHALLEPIADIPLNSHQKAALKALKNPEIKTSTRLLHGITGSGKTNIYLTLTAEALRNGKSTVLLVPEIALTSQLVQVFSKTFNQNEPPISPKNPKIPQAPTITLLHSNLTPKERREIWKNLLLSTSPQIIIGPRSALFSPVHNLGLIIIDEAHESTYYQNQTPKYSALRLASFITNYLTVQQNRQENQNAQSSQNTQNHQKVQNQPLCIQGTATPLISDLYLAKSHNAYVPLTEKALTKNPEKTAAKKSQSPGKTEKAKPLTITPTIKILDLKNRAAFSKNRYFSDTLLSSIKSNLEKNRQTLIFHNRRGSAPLTICEKCGWQALCPACFLPLTLHTDHYELICHTCGHKAPVPHSCPTCNCPNIIHKGFGTKLLELELNKIFKDTKTASGKPAEIARFDADNTKNASLDALYDDVKSGAIDIIIGTQTVAKGLDLPHLATVGIIQADSSLSLPDFTSEERTFHLITQVIGRVGRGHLDTAEVFLQTYQPNHPVILAAAKNDYAFFANYLLEKRKKTALPPFSYLAKISITYKTEATVLKHITNLHSSLVKFSNTSTTNSSSIKISAPAPAFHEHTSSGFTWQLIVKSTSRKSLLAALKPLRPNAHLHLTLDPPTLL